MDTPSNHSNYNNSKWNNFTKDDSICSNDNDSRESYYSTKRTKKNQKKYIPVNSRVEWSKEEDSLILELVCKYGNCWKEISKHLKGRTCKMIRGRYINFLRSDVNKNKFSTEEDFKIAELYLQYGPKWSLLANLMNGRTADMIKNRYHSKIKKNINHYMSKVILNNLD
jgi:hypothetical protein